MLAGEPLDDAVSSLSSTTLGRIGAGVSSKPMTMTCSPALIRCAAAPLIEMMPEPRSPAMM